MKNTPGKQTYWIGTAIIALAPLVAAASLLSPKSLLTDLREILALLLRE